ncbi:MAG TPA: glycoside hydrolase family 16 protein [Terriglobales bacterium]|jgi:beta-glucanase (GH16 family)|nr:glycoside hydrolase family 16 protein [Terriglobales bacterium]
MNMRWAHLRSALGQLIHIFMPLLACALLPSVAAGQSWKLTWSDEFNGATGTAIDSKKWQFERGDLKVNNELEFYCAPSDGTPCDPGNPNASIDGRGHLLIQARRISDAIAPSSKAWTSARLNTSNKLASFLYGRIESRMQLPVGAGIWPAFWSLGTNIDQVNWPTCGEMDYMENVPLVGHLGPLVVKSTIHGPDYSGGEGIGKDRNLSAPVTEFHTYGAIWSPFMIQFYVDDAAEVFFVLTPQDLPKGKQWVFEHPFFLLLNLAVGGTDSWPGPPDSATPNPARMFVDYVRVYKAERIKPPKLSLPKDAIRWNGEDELKIPLKISASPGSGRMYISCSSDEPGLACSISTGDELNDTVVNFTNKSSVPTEIRLSKLAAANVNPGARLKTSTIHVRAWTVASNPDDPKTYAETKFSVRVH